MDKNPVWEKMSKSRGNVVLPEEVVYGVAELDPKYEFRDFLGEVVDYKEQGVWQDKLNTGFFFTATRFKREPVWLCEKDSFDAEGKPIPLVLLIDGEEKVQHPEELDKIKYYVPKYYLVESCSSQQADSDIAPKSTALSIVETAEAPNGGSLSTVTPKSGVTTAPCSPCGRIKRPK